MIQSGKFCIETNRAEFHTVDSGEALDDDGAAAEMPGLEGGVLPTATLAVVLVSHHHPLLALLLVIPGRGRDRARLAVQEVLHFVDLTVIDVQRTESNLSKVQLPRPGHLSSQTLATTSSVHSH